MKYTSVVALPGPSVSPRETRADDGSRPFSTRTQSFEITDEQAGIRLRPGRYGTEESRRGTAELQAQGARTAKGALDCAQIRLRRRRRAGVRGHELPECQLSVLPARRELRASG